MYMRHKVSLRKRNMPLLLGCYLVLRVYRYYCPNKTLEAQATYFDTDYDDNGCIHFVQNKEALDGPSRTLGPTAQGPSYEPRQNDYAMMLLL